MPKAAALAPDVIAALTTLRDRLAALPPKGGERGRLVREFAALHGCAPQTVHAWLKRHAGRDTGRKKRADAGRTVIAESTLDFIAGSMKLGVRGSGQHIKPLAVAMNIADASGLEVNLSASRIGTLLRQRRLDVARQDESARNHIRMRSLFPNHVHQVDPSLCVVYYLHGRMCVMEEAEFNKNKLDAYAKVKMKVWRYVRYDHASGAIDVRYYLSEGENQRVLFDFLCHTWSRQPGRLSYGLPKMLLWDKGSANTSHGVRRMLDAMGVQHEAHARHHAWVKGGVENANRLVEIHFESRLRDEPVDNVEALNASAAAWARDYNANALKFIDSRIVRDDGERHVRDDLWALIAHHDGALVEMPGREACAWFMTGKQETRTVRDGRITFAHPQSGKSELYIMPNDLARYWHNGQQLQVEPMLLADCALRVSFEQPDGKPLTAQLAPEREFDAFGRSLQSAVIGEERRSAPHTAAQIAGRRIAEATYGQGTTLDQAEEMKARNVRPFQHLNDGKGAVAHSHLGRNDLPTRLLPAPSEARTAELDALRLQAAVRVLPHFEAAQALVARGVAMSGELLATLKSLHPDGVPEAELDDLQRRLTVRAGLRVVGGGDPA
ncbi:MAG: DDE-type integrase/transposase/recombinase [Burkholderiaceae bacterium]|nr:DDE-type integrase/transposase/recombinase [Burkholderiaceae bacterium]